MTLPVELETSVNQLRLKHTALIDAVNAYRSGTIVASKQELLTLADDIDKQLTVEEYTLLGQVARKGRMPSLLLDFANGKYAVGDRRLERFTSLGELLTVTRSTGGGRFNAQGQYEWVEADVPRIDYDPVTGECLGLLVEEQGTNLIVRSQETRWINGQTGNTEGVSLVDNTDVITSTFIPQAVRYENSAARYGLYESVNHDAGVTYTITLRMKSSIHLSTAAIGIVSGTRQSATGFPLLPTDGFKTVTITYTANTQGYSYLTFPAEGIYEFAYIQRELGPFPTSYIPTQGSAVTRAGDMAKVEDQSPWNAHQRGTFLSHGTSLLDPGAPRGRVYFQRYADNSSRVGLTLEGIARSGDVGGSLQLPEHVTPLALNDQAVKFALSWEITKSMAVGVNGEAFVASSPAESAIAKELPLYLGAYVTSMAYTSGISRIKRLEYYPFALTENELQELTSL